MKENKYVEIANKAKNIKRIFSEVQEELLPANIAAYKNQFYSVIRAYDRKPVVGLFGNYDSGKSTIACDLIGKQSFLPTGFAPLTSIPTLLVYIQDRPEDFDKEVYVLNELLDPTLWRNKNYSDETCIIAKGGYDLLESSVYSTEAKFALVFVDADILKFCSILDLPGYGSDSTMNDICTLVNVDVVLYLSPIMGFLSANEMNWLRDLFKKLPYYGKNWRIFNSIYFIATHCHIGFQNENSFASAVERIKKIFGDSEFFTTYQIVESEIRNRMFPYYGPDNKNNFADLDTLLYNTLPDIWSLRFNGEVEKIKNKLCRYLSRVINANQVNIRGWEQDEEKLMAYQAIECERKCILAEKNAEIKEIIERLSNDSIVEILEYYDKLITQKQVQSVIETKFKEKGDTIKALADYLVGLLKDQLIIILTRNSLKLNSKFEEYMSIYEDCRYKDTLMSLVKYNALDAFSSGSMTLKSIGAFSSMLPMINDGVLVAASLSMASYYCSAATIALTGWSVVGLAIGGVLIALVHEIFWQKKFAEEIVKQFETQGVKSHLEHIVTSYWNDTFNAFELGSDAMEKQWQGELDKTLCKIRTDYELNESMVAQVKAMVALREHINRL